MKFDLVITRDELTFGSDTVPTDDDYLENDNVFFAPQYGPDSEPLESIAVAYNAPAHAPTATLDFYLWDELTQAWYWFNTDDVALSTVVWVSLPNIIDRKNSRHESRIAVAVVVTVVGELPEGTYKLALASSPEHYQVHPPLPPYPVVGWEEDDSPATFPPVVAGGKYMAVPDALEDGDAGYLWLDTNHRLMMSLAGEVVEVQGVDADDSAMTAKPVAVGGKYMAVPDALEDGDAGYLSLTPAHRLWTSLEGIDAESSPITVNPFLIGGKCVISPTTDLDAGDAGCLAITAERRLWVTLGGTLTQVEGYVDDNTSVSGTFPVLVGGEYRATPSASPLDDGDAGRALMNNLRMFIVEVANISDVTEISGSTGSNTTFPYYFDLTNYEYFSVEFLPVATGTTGNVSLTYQVSNEESQPIGSRGYTSDMSQAWFGSTSYPSGVGGTTSYAHEKNNPTPWLSMRLLVTTTGIVAGTVSWTIRVRTMSP